MQTTEALHIISDLLKSEVTLLPSDVLDCIVKDSLDFIWLIQEVEKRTEVTIPNDALMQFNTVGDIADYVASHT
jgi:acyl carrier protein